MRTPDVAWLLIIVLVVLVILMLIWGPPGDWGDGAISPWLPQRA